MIMTLSPTVPNLAAGPFTNTVSDPRGAEAMALMKFTYQLFSGRL